MQLKNTTSLMLMKHMSTSKKGGLDFEDIRAVWEEEMNL